MASEDALWALAGGALALAAALGVTGVYVARRAS
jgi:hypothetical protein